MTRRPGLTLVEVLTALFILALGVIAILTMFPLGASQMAVAVRESRSAEAAFNADAFFRTYWKTEVVEKGGGTEPFFAALTNPNSGLSAGFTHLVGGPLLPIAGPGEASYPVLVDAMGYVARNNGSMSQYWLGDAGDTHIPRRSINTVGTDTQKALRLFSLMDTLGYDDIGTPMSDRELRYNFLYVIRQPNTSNPYVAEMMVVCFDRRAHLYAPPGSEAVLYSTFNVADPTSGARPGSSSIRFDSTPDLKPGAWIMDASVSTNPAVSKMRNANFYRVTAIDGTTNTVELQSPIKVPSDNINAPYTGTFVVPRGVSGVYVRAPLTAGE